MPAVRDDERWLHEVSSDGATGAESRRGIVIVATTRQVMDASRRLRQHATPMTADTSCAAGVRLRRLRAAQRVSQLDLSLRVGVSQRHLSCIETGRANASREMLLALLDALAAPLAERNATLLAAGFAPAFGQRPLDAPPMAPAREALGHLLAAHEPAPALVLDGLWNLVLANQGARRLFTLLGRDAELLDAPLNMLRATLAPDGLRDTIINHDEVCHEVWQRAQREALHLGELRALVDELAPYAPRAIARAQGDSPLLYARLRSAAGDLSFFSTFTTFGSPLDITLASLRVEHMFPADEFTRQALSAGG